MGKYTPKLKGKREKYRTELRATIEEFGEWDVNILALSRKWGIPESTLSRWKQEIVKEIGPLDIKRAGMNMQLTILSNLKLCKKLVKEAKTIKDKLAAIKVHNETEKSLTDFLEAYGYKEKVAEKIVQDTSMSWKDFNAAYAEVQKSRKKKKAPHSA